jgi:hypothetical protein
MRDVLSHFGHRYRTHGNMLCCWHSEQNPSARLYDDDDRFWCWVCAPAHGVDIIEFVNIELGLEVDVDPGNRLTPNQRHALATARAIAYLEEAFQVSYAATPWEQRLHQSLERHTPRPQPDRYWRDMHLHALRLLSSSSNPDRWHLYSSALSVLSYHRNSSPEIQRPLWNALSAALVADSLGAGTRTILEPESSGSL